MGPTGIWLVAITSDSYLFSRLLHALFQDIQAISVFVLKTQRDQVIMESYNRQR